MARLFARRHFLHHCFLSLFPQHYRDVNLPRCWRCKFCRQSGLTPGCYVLILIWRCCFGADWRRGHAIF
ncbi:hypothetical protein KCP78_10230 [Salmonella enterica subsp. enterica]|nr:hypothetical protein KCP78_10230 [Salmonella enterica subsp. enterica]